MLLSIVKNIFKKWGYFFSPSDIFDNDCYKFVSFILVIISSVSVSLKIAYIYYIVIYVLIFSKALLLNFALAITNKFSGKTLGNHDETLTSPLLSLKRSIPLNSIMTLNKLY